MKIPVEWLKQYINTKKTAKELAESFTNLGLMLDKPVSNYQEGKYTTEVLDLEHRMDRSDWLSLLGCARDLAAYEHTKLIQPEVYDKKPKPLEENSKIKIDVQCPDLVHRFNTRLFKNIKVKPSPDWLKNRLEAYGIPSINNIVDITNYVMVELGQPMHAQDVNKFEKPEIVIRRAKNGEKITTLLGEIVELDESAFVLTQNDLPTVIGGIVGGVATGIDESTTEIILDAGNYNQVNIRKTSRKLKIQNETVMRYDKFLHHDLTELAIQRATKLILDLAGGEYYENTDWYPTKVPLKKIKLRFSRIQKIGGNLPMEKDFIVNTLERLGYKTLNKNEEGYELEVPYYRTDVEIEDDIVSDLLRIYGYPNIPFQPLDIAAPKDITPKIYKFEDALKDMCLSLNLHEHITDPLVAADNDMKTQVRLENSQSSLKNALRTEIYSGLMTVGQNYEKHKIDDVRLFEIGKVYSRKNESKELADFEELRLTQVLIRNNEDNNTNSLMVRKTLDAIMQLVGVEAYALTDQTKGKAKIIIQNEIIGELQWDAFNLQNEILMKYWNNKNYVHTEFENIFVNDISLMVPIELKLGEMLKTVGNLPQLAKDTEIELLPQNFRSQDKDKKNVVMRIKHKLNNFTSVREMIVNELNSKLNIEVK